MTSLKSLFLGRNLNSKCSNANLPPSKCFFDCFYSIFHHIRRADLKKNDLIINSQIIANISNHKKWNYLSASSSSGGVTLKIIGSLPVLSCPPARLVCNVERWPSIEPLSANYSLQRCVDCLLGIPVTAGGGRRSGSDGLWEGGKTIKSWIRGRRTSDPENGARKK